MKFGGGKSARKKKDIESSKLCGALSLDNHLPQTKLSSDGSHGYDLAREISSMLSRKWRKENIHKKKKKLKKWTVNHGPINKLQPNPGCTVSFLSFALASTFALMIEW